MQMTNALLKWARQNLKSQETRLILKTENDDLKKKFEKRTWTYSLKEVIESWKFVPQL